MAIERITSFTVDHTLLYPGIYVSRIDGDITTYDLRMRKPNTGDLVDNASLHSLEHMLATFMRNSELKEDVIYVGPMGCQTGFYLLMRNADNRKVLEVLMDALRKTAEYTGPVFGASEKECGNYRNLDATLAAKEARRYLEVLTQREAQGLNTFEYDK